MLQIPSDSMGRGTSVWQPEFDGGVQGWLLYELPRSMRYPRLAALHARSVAWTCYGLQEDQLPGFNSVFELRQVGVRKRRLAEASGTRKMIAA
jgi:hypothetical protein